MEDQPWVFCGRWENHLAHGDTCPGTGRCAHRDVHEPHLVLDGTLAPYWCFGHRARLYREGKPTNDGRMLRETLWREEPLPLLTVDPADDDRTGHFGAVIVGQVTKLQHEQATGWVTGLIDVQKRVPDGLTAAEADFDWVGVPETVTVKGQEVSLMRGARLSAVTLGNRPTWDEMTIPW